MNTDRYSLQTVYKGWGAYQESLVQAVAPLSVEQLAWRPAAHLRSTGEIASHIATGRIRWFHHFMGEGSGELASLAASGQPTEAIAGDAAELVKWLEISWQLVVDVLKRYTLADLDHIFPHTYQGQKYAVPRQWVISRIFAHDLHHGGELSLMLGIQGIAVPGLGDDFGQPEAPLVEE